MTLDHSVDVANHSVVLRPERKGEKDLVHGSAFGAIRNN
jgi:hypothetical protein